MNKNEDGEYGLKRREFKGERIKETMGIKEKKLYQSDSWW